MAIQVQGNSGVVAEVDGTTFRALRTAPRPIDHGALGFYRVSVVTGTLAAALAASAQLFQFKWTDPTRLAVILRIQSRFQTLTRFTANTLTDFTSLDTFLVRGYTGGGGGTTLTLTGNNQKKRTSMGTSLATINVSTTAALTAVSATLDAHPFAQSLGQGETLTTSTTLNPLGERPIGLDYEVDIADGNHPPVLAANEGFLIRNRTAWPAAGTGVYSFMVSWAEVAAF